MRARFAAVALVMAAVSLTGCAATVPMEPAQDAANPACANVIVGLRDVSMIDDNAKRQTSAQGTLAWGQPATILLTCGVPVPGPSTLRCITIEGVDWLVDDTDEAVGVFTTFGRDPATQVVVDHVTSDSNALNAISNAVATNPATRACTSAEDFSTGDDAILGN